MEVQLMPESSLWVFVSQFLPQDLNAEEVWQGKLKLGFNYENTNYFNGKTYCNHCIYPLHGIHMRKVFSSLHCGIETDLGLHILLIPMG